MSEPKFTGVWIPAMVFQNANLSMTAKLLYGVVAALDGSDGCYASNAYLQRHLGLSERSIQAVLKELDDACLIRREEFNGKRIIRTVESIALSNANTNTQVTRSEEGCRKLRRGVQKTAGEGCRKLHPYNIVDNKEDNNNKSMPWAEGVEAPFESEAFQKAWMAWIDYRKELKKALKPTTVKAQWKQFAVWGEAKSIKAIEISIKNGWTGLFEPHMNNQYKQYPLQAKDHDVF
jgi:hypothetical protein